MPTRFDNNNKSNGSRNVQSNAAILSVDNVLNSISSIPVNGYSAEALSPASAFNPFDCVFTNRGRDNNYEGLEGLLDGLRLNANDNVEDEDNSGGGAAEEDGMDIDTRGESGVDDEKSAMDDSVHFDAGGNDMEEEEEERNDMEVEDEAVRNDVSCVVVCCIVCFIWYCICYIFCLYSSLSLSVSYIYRMVPLLR